MGFAATTMLWALPVALLPLAIHLLMRLRSQRRAWGADWVLSRAIARLGRRTDWEQMLLIALRGLVCAALVVAFARPVAQGAAALASGSGVHRIIVLDASASMAAAEGGVSRWQASLDLARSLVATWGRGERWSLLLAGAEPRWIVRDAAISDPAEAATTLATLRPEEAAPPIGRALAAAVEAAGAGPAEIYLCADDQASAWRDVAPSARPDPALVRLVWVCPPLRDRANRAVTALRPAAEQALVGHPLRVTATVRNLGPAPLDDLPVEFLVDGAIAGSVRVAIQPGQELAVRHDLRFDAPGPRLVTARLPPDVLTSDDQAVAAVAVRARLRLLVLRDTGRDGTLDSAWPFIDAACRVLARSDREGRPLWSGGPLIATLHEGALDSAPLSEADVVLLDGSRSLAPGDGTRLAAWTARGGALLLCADERIDAARWRDELAALLPATLAGMQAAPAGAGLALARPAGDGGALDAFAGAEDGDLGKLRVFARRQLTPAAGARSLLAFADGTPAVLARRDGLGAVVLLAAGLDGRSGNLAVREAFYPLLTRLLLAAAEGSGSRRTVGVREPLRLRLDAPGVTAATVALGDGQAQAMAVAADMAELAGSLPASGPATVLLLRDGGSERITLAVQSPPPDSDLTALGADERSGLLAQLAMAEARDRDSLAAVVAAWRGGEERFAAVALLVLILLAVELILLRRFD
jgi:hypothetical protein